jgi:hypothetical protein
MWGGEWMTVPSALVVEGQDGGAFAAGGVRNLLLVVKMKRVFPMRIISASDR